MALALVALVMSSCTGGPSGGTSALHVVNQDDPLVRVYDGQALVAEVPCGSVGEIGPGAVHTGFPWTLDVRTADGTDMSATVAGPLPAALVVSGGSVLVTDWPITSGPSRPSPDPCAT